MLTEQLTGREYEILKRLSLGLSDQQIADELFLSLNTVKWYNRHIYGKLGVSSRTQAVARIQELQAQQGAPPAAPAQPHLPADITSFIGRKRESAEIQRLLEQNRLVTLVGLPGTGKTRLALQAARQANDAFRDGVYFVPLASIQAVDNLIWTIADRLDFQFESRGNPLAQLLAYLQEKALLLVLDNFDQLIAGGGLLTEILRAASAVKMLVTARERLGLYGEVSYTVGGLSLPPEDQPEQAARSEAVELFVERAKSVSPGLDLEAQDLQQIVRICRLVEGLPLGIELAATWVDTLQPQEIADEIEHDIDILAAERQDVPPAQRSIRAAFDRSWSSLDELQAAAFRRLSVFRGGLRREAAKAVAGVELRTLQALVNKSLLRHNASTGRYDIHELLRHYAQEQLESSGEAEAIDQAHAAYFADFMAERWPKMKDYRQKAALLEVRADFENVKIAWGYWLKQRNVSQLKKFLHSFWVVYDILGWYPAGIDLFEQGAQALESLPGEEAQACLGWLLAVQGLFSVPVKEYDQALEDAPTPLWLATHGLYNAIGMGPERGLHLAKNGNEILRRLERHKEMWIVPLMALFIIASQMPGEEAATRQAALDCLATATEIDDRWAIAKANQFLAVWAIEDGEYSQARQMADEALMTFQANGDQWSISVVCIEVLGLLEVALRQYDEARMWIRKGLEAAEEINFNYSIQTAYWQLGYVAALEENYSQAGIYWSKALAVSDRMLGGRSFLGFGNRRPDAALGGRLPAAG